MVGDKLWFQDNSTINLTQLNTRGLPIATDSRGADPVKSRLLPPR
jgi:hypothetical protein